MTYYIINIIAAILFVLYWSFEILGYDGIVAIVDHCYVSCEEVYYE